MSIPNGAFISKRPAYVTLSDDSTVAKDSWAANGVAYVTDWYNVSEGDVVGFFAYLSASTLGKTATGTITVEYAVSVNWSNSSPNPGPFIYNATSFPSEIITGTKFTTGQFDRASPATDLEYFQIPIGAFEFIRFRITRASGNGNLQINLFQKHVGAPQ